MSATTIPGWLIIVRRDQRDLYASLHGRLADLRLIDVILDRRRGEPRRTGSPILGARRESDRRSAPSPAERDRWYSFGYRMVALPVSHRSGEGG